MINSRKIDQFKLHLIEFGVLDPERVHHEFGQGLHGRKVDFDKIDEERDGIFSEWVNINVEFIEAEYPQRPDALVGVANGTNRLAEKAAEEIGGGILFLATEKNQQSKPVLTDEAKMQIKEIGPEFALIDEDVGTVGTNSLSAAKSVLEAGVTRAEVLNTWQRSETLELLDEAGIAYRSIIKHVLPSYTPEECRGEGGLCGAGWELVPYEK